MTGEPQAAARAALPRLEPLELYSGIIAGRRRTPTPPSRMPDLTGTPREVLEALLIEPLSNAPCHVAFSGGRDSSAMLATATLVARREGLPDPIPLTMRLEKYPRTWETEWQELTLRHLGLTDWNHVPVEDDLDALGPEATGALRRHGHYWPSQAHTMLVLARAAGSGSLLTGGGGDEVLASWSQKRLSLRATAKLRPLTRAVKWTAFALLPQRVQTEYLLSTQRVTTPWMRREFERQLQRELRQRSRRRTANWGEVLEGFIASRYLELLQPVFETFTLDYGVRLYEPFHDQAFIRAMIATAPSDGYRNRTEGLTAHFGDVLPSEVLRRGTKAVFTEVARGPGAAAFAASWDGTGLDEAFVDPQVLREEWAREKPNPRTLSSLHLAWLVAQGLA